MADAMEGHLLDVHGDVLEANLQSLTQGIQCTSGISHHNLEGF
jgi:hypothetical protein